MNATLTAYVFAIRREIDREPWAAVYYDKELALRAPGRISDVVEVQLRTCEHPLDACVQDTQSHNDGTVFCRACGRRV